MGKARTKHGRGMTKKEQKQGWKKGCQATNEGENDRVYGNERRRRM